MGVPTSTTSGLQTSDAAVVARPAALATATLIADGTNAATLVVYDNKSAASGTVLAKLSIAALGTVQQLTYELPVEASNGIYADVTGTGAAYIITYYTL